jgi:hypothetical protein
VPAVADIAPGDSSTDPGWAATAAFAAVSGILAGEFRPAEESLVAACGPAAWVVGVAVDEIESARSYYARFDSSRARARYCAGVAPVHERRARVSEVALSYPTSAAIRSTPSSDVASLVIACSRRARDR